MANKNQPWDMARVASRRPLPKDTSEKPVHLAQMHARDCLYLSSEEFKRDPGSAMQHALSQPIVILGADKRPRLILTRTLRPLDDDE